MACGTFVVVEDEFNEGYLSFGLLCQVKTTVGTFNVPSLLTSLSFFSLFFITRCTVSPSL